MCTNNGFICGEEKRTTLRDTRNFAHKLNIPKCYQQMALCMSGKPSSHSVRTVNGI